MKRWLFVMLAVLAGVDGRSEPARPNILFALADDWSFPHASAYGCPWVQTPNFDRVAGQGLLFRRAYTPTAKCAPSRSSIITGRYPWQLKAAANHWCFFPPEFKSFAEALGEHGVNVGMTAKGWAPGVATNEQGQTRRLTGMPFNQRRTTPPTDGMSSIDYAANFADFLAAAPTNAPWFFWYGAGEPHRGYEYASGVAKGGKQLADVGRVPACWPDNEVVRNDLLDYAFEVEHFDRHLGRILDLLEQRGLLSNTLVLVTSDNGMPFPRGKGNSYELSHHMPMAARWPQGIAAPGRVVDDLVSFVDLAPTFIELAGLRWEQTGMAPAAGRSLVPLFTSTRGGLIDPARDHVIIGRERHDVGRPHDQGYPVRGIVKGDQLYLHNFEPTRWPAGNPETGYLDCDGGPTKTEVLTSRARDPAAAFWSLCFGVRPREELYDLRADADCVKNLAPGPAAEALREQLFTALRDQNDPRIAGDGATLEAYPYANPADRNFHARQARGENVRADWVNPTDAEILPATTAVP